MTKHEAEILAVEIVKQVEQHIGNQRRLSLITIDGPLLIAQIYAVLLETKINLVD